MREDGFSIIELVLVMAIIGTLLTIGALNFNQYTQKGAIEGQARMILSDLAVVRTEAFYQKRSRAVEISGSDFKVYSSAATSVSPISTKALRVPLTLSSAGAIVFDGRGFFNETPSRAICMNPPANAAAIDIVVVGGIRDNLAKRNDSFTGCNSDSANINLK